jgi:cytochrome P450
MVNLESKKCRESTMNDASKSLADYDTATCPFEFFQRLRSEDPVHFDEGVGTYLVTRYDDVAEVLNDPARFSFGMGGDALRARSESALLDEFTAIMNSEGLGPFITTVDSDPPYHRRIRSLSEKAFQTNRVASLAPGISAVAHELVRTAIARGHADIVKDVSIPMTAAVLGGQLGIPREREKDFIRWTNATFDPLTGRPLGRDRMLECAHEQAELQRFLAEVIELRRNHPENDIISNLVHATLPDFDPPELTLPEMLSMVRSLLVAGNDTTNSAISDMFLMFARQPHLLSDLQALAPDERDRALTRFIEEFLRLAAPITSLPRVVTADTTVGDVPVPKGAVLSVCYASANRDDARFGKPDQFDTARGNLIRHMTFGQGIHRCVGAALARGELRAVLQEIVNQIDAVAIDVNADSFPREHSVMGRRLTSLPVRLKARANAATS